MSAAISDKQLKALLYPDGRQKDIYRKISYPFVKLILPWNIHPDIIHLFRLLFIVFGTILFFEGSLVVAIIGALFFQLNILFDTFDGALARHQGKASVKGEYQDVALDHLTSAVLYFASFAGLAYVLNQDTIYLWLGLLIIILAHVAAFLRAMYIEYAISTKTDNALVNFAYQDNSRMIAFILLTTSVVTLIISKFTIAYYLISIVAILLLLVVVVSKIVILSAHLAVKSGRNPLNIQVLVRYLVVVIIIKLWLWQKILGVRTQGLRDKLSRSKHKSVIEKHILKRLE